MVLGSETSESEGNEDELVDFSGDIHSLDAEDCGDTSMAMGTF